MYYKPQTRTDLISSVFSACRNSFRFLLLVVYSINHFFIPSTELYLWELPYFLSLKLSTCHRTANNDNYMQENDHLKIYPTGHYPELDLILTKHDLEIKGPTLHLFYAPMLIAIDDNQLPIA